MSYTTTNHISLDIYNNSIVCVNAKQYDTNARYVEVTCTENWKKIVLVQDEVKAYISCQKPDGKYVYNDATILENGNIQIELTQQMLAEVGRCKVDVMLLDADGEININKNNELVLLNSSVLTTMYFYINVLSSTVNHSDIESSNEYNALLHAMSRNVALEKELQENEYGIVDEKGKVIEDGRKQTEEKRVAAEIVREQQEAIREQQEAKRIETFNKNEANRQSTFDTNESNRQKTFTDNEITRSNTFTTNENGRIAKFTENEQYRKDTFKASEAERSSIFTASEESRTATFSNSEVSRETIFNGKITTWQASVDETIQECEDATNASIQAEETRSTNFTTSMKGWNTQISDAITSCNDAEALRVSAESSRVTAENSRVIAEKSRQTNTASAISACEEAISNAITATENADNATERATVAAEACENIVAGILYPVGSIYMSVNNVNPSLLFGGTWEQIKDTFLLAAGDTYEGGLTGGEEEHTLTLSEIPTHKHGEYADFGTSAAIPLVSDASSGSSTTGAYFNYSANPSIANISYSSKQVETTSVGGGQSHNNMPPYLTVYMWIRTE